MSGLEMNKIAGAILGAGVIAMMSGFIAQEVIFPGKVRLEGGHAYPIAVGNLETTTAAEEPAAGVETILPLLASADVAKGERAARKCTSCHAFEEGGPNKIGPALWGVVDRGIAADGSFAYSDALKGLSGEKWTYENLNEFIARPKDFAPGTKMSFAGLRKTQDRADLVAYMRTMSSSPAPLPE